MFRKFVVLVLMLATIQALSHELRADIDPKTAERIEMAMMFVAQMSEGEFDKAVEPFDRTMKKALTTDKLKELWNGLVKQLGPLKRATQAETETIQQYEVVYVTCEFERGTVDTKVVFTPAHEITGLFFVPPGRYRDPAYADFTKFEEKEIETGSKDWRLPGTLALPNGNGPFPAVILVHGSGPNDRDETIGPNKPFRDLAYGLASRGIAVLRYEKRTKQHSLMMVLMTKSVTTKEETVDDALSAFETLAVQPKIDSKRIFLLGHSLGGAMFPRIGRINDRFAGFISLAGSTRPLEDLILEQTQFILSLEGSPTDKNRKIIADLEKQVAQAKRADLSEETPVSELPLGVPPKYWLDLRGYDPAEMAKAILKPILILQGERDYQVTMEDFAGWKRALGTRNDVKFISYPTLNHLFVEGQGKSQPAEYTKPGNVAETVVTDIAKWIKEKTVSLP